MPATAFDGSIWVAGGQIAGLVGSTVVMAGVGTLLLARGIARNPQFSQPTEVVRGRRKMALSVKQPEEQQRTPVTLDAERLEDVLAGKDASPKQKEEALKEVSTKPSK